jgi:hypothetical protein
MKSLSNIDTLHSSLETTKKAIILLGSTANFDTAASALGFMLALKKKGIDVTVASLADMRVEFSRLVGVDEVRKKVGNKNLVVSFDYTEDQVEKVSYNISEDGKRFNLVIAPKNGALPLQPETVKFEFTGADAEFIAFFGVNSLQELGPLYDNDRTVFDQAMTVAFTLFPTQPFAKCHLDAQGLSSLSELTANAVVQLKLELDPDSASNLLSGIDASTQGFNAPNVGPDTFELAATLMRAGGKRQPSSGNNTILPTQMPYMPSPGPLPSMSQPVQQADNNQFAQLLGATQKQPSQNVPVSMTGEFKG